MKPEQVGTLRAVGELIMRRLSQVQPGANRIELPAPHITNEVATPEVNVTNRVETPEVTVHIDMTPVAEAIGRMSQVMESLLKVTQQLVKAVSQQLPPEVHPVIQIPETTVHVSPPSVTVEGPTIPPRTKRRLKVKHSDGTESVIIEE